LRRIIRNINKFDDGINGNNMIHIQINDDEKCLEIAILRIQLENNT
jgi:hypothetical protein